MGGRCGCPARTCPWPGGSDADGSKLTVAGVVQGSATITVTAQGADGRRVIRDFAVSVTAPQEQKPEPDPTDVVARDDVTPRRTP